MSLTGCQSSQSCPKKIFNILKLIYWISSSIHSVKTTLSIYLLFLSKTWTILFECAHLHPLSEQSTKKKKKKSFWNIKIQRQPGGWCMHIQWILVETYCRWCWLPWLLHQLRRNVSTDKANVSSVIVQALVWANYVVAASQRQVSSFGIWKLKVGGEKLSIIEASPLCRSRY